MSNEEDQVSADITVTSVEVPELTEEEQRARLHLERKVERAFFEAGKALMELRDADFTVQLTTLSRIIAVIDLVIVADSPTF